MRGGKIQRAGKTLLSAAVAALILFYLLRGLVRSWREAEIYSWSIDPLPLAAAFVLVSLYFLLVAAVWKRILHGLGQEISFRQSCTIWFLSQMGKYIPGKIWFAMGRIYMSRQAGVDALPATASTVMELLLVILASALVFLVSLPLWPGFGMREGILALAGVAGIVALLHPKMFSFLLRTAARVMRREAIPYTIAWREISFLVLAYVASWFIYGTGFDLIARAVHLEGAIVPAELGAFHRILFFSGAAAASWSIGFLSFLTPSGLGVREAALGYMLSVYLPPPLPMFLALAARIWITLAELGSALCGWLLRRSSHEG